MNKKRLNGVRTLLIPESTLTAFRRKTPTVYGEPSPILPMRGDSEGKVLPHGEKTTSKSPPLLTPRWRKVLRDLWINKTRTVLVVLSIAVGVFAVGMITSSQLILSSDLSANYVKTNPAHATFYGRFDDQTVKTVRRMEEVLDAEGRGEIEAQLQVGPDEWHDLRLTSISDYDDIRISQIRPVSGAWPPDEREFLIEQSSFSALQVEVGESVIIEQEDGKRREMRISGVVHSLDDPSYLFDPIIKGYINRETQEWLSGGRQLSELHILVAEDVMDQDDIKPVADTVKDKLEKGNHVVTWTRIGQPGEHWADDMIQSMMLILGTMGSLSLILSSFFVVNTISALLTQQTRQIGMMKAIGARSGQLIQMYLLLVLIFGLLSLTIAVPLGAWTAHLFVNFMANVLNSEPIGFRIPLQALVLEISVAVLVPLLAALWPVMAGTRLTVKQALSSYGLGQAQFGRHPIDQFFSNISGLPRPLLLSLRNTFRRKGRLLLTLSTLVLGSAIFIAVLSVHSSLIATLDEALAYWNYDVGIYLSRSYRVDQITREALRVPGVVAAESWISSNARRVRDDESESPDIFVLGPPADTQMIKPNLLAGRWLLPEDENALVINSVVLDEDPDIKIGSTIELNIDGRKSTWQVVGMVQGVLSGPMAYANYPYFARQIRFVGRASLVNLITEQHDTDFQLQTTTALTEHFKRLGLNVSSSESTSESRTNIINQFNVIVLILVVMAILIAVVGALGLMGTMSINVLERSREIGVMRAIGASNGSVLRIFLVEGMLIALLSWLIGSLLAFPISKLLSDAVGIAFLDAPLNYTFSISGVMLWLVIILILAALSSWWPSWRASRLTVRDVLAYE